MFRCEFFWPENYRKCDIFGTKTTENYMIFVKKYTDHKQQNIWGFLLWKWLTKKTTKNVILLRRWRNSNDQERYFFVKNNEVLLLKKTWQKVGGYWSEHNLVHEDNLTTTTLLNAGWCSKKESHNIAISVI